MERSPAELRVLASLVEKQLMTPDNYPLSTNALVVACNQRTNREPVVDYDERTVDAVMLELRRDGLARTVTSGRTNKHRHVLDEALGLEPRELSLLAVLLLRGPQTVGELRIRTERMADFIDLDDVEVSLAALAAHDPSLAVRLERRPGQKEARWRHLLGENAPEPAIETDPRGQADHSVKSVTSTTEALWNEVVRLRSDVDHLYALLGEAAPPAGTAVE